MQSAALLGILRESTRLHHQELDSSSRLGRLARGEVDLNFYVEMLRRYRTCYASVESLLDSSSQMMASRGESGWLPDAVPYLQRLSAIDHDLALLLPQIPEPAFSQDVLAGSAFPRGSRKTDLQSGWGSCSGLAPQAGTGPEVCLDSEADLDRQTPMQDLSRTAPAEFELGVRYVPDGSSMGASVIHRQLLKTTGRMLEHASRFWEIQKRVGKDWPIIRNRLQDIVQEVDLPLARIRHITDSARLCFQIFRRAFDAEGQR